MPVLEGERQKAKGLFGRADFAFDSARDVYVCLAGHDLRTTGAVIPGGLKQYRAKPTSCAPAPSSRGSHHQLGPHGHA